MELNRDPTYLFVSHMVHNTTYLMILSCRLPSNWILINEGYKLAIVFNALNVVETKWMAHLI